MNTDKMKPEDFIVDVTFLAWFERSDSVHVRYWDEWIRDHPESKDDVEVAVKLLSLLKMEQVKVSVSHTTQSKERLMTAIEAAETKTPAIVPIYRRKILRWAVAAAILGLIFLYSAQQWITRHQQFNTGFAQTKMVALPDSSIVTLNANSSIAFKRNWKPGATREVWLDGEGFFSVKHTAANSRFIVHAQDVNVEVLGTEFDLKRRKEKTTVVLKSGSVKLTVADYGTSRSLMMKPGDLVEYVGTKVHLVTKKVNPDIYSAWKEGYIVFENATATMIAEQLEEFYGVTVDINGLDLHGEQFNGTFASNNLDLLLQALSKVYNIKIEKNGKHIKIYKPVQ